MNDKKTLKKLYSILKNCVSKDETRPFLQGVYHCSKLKALVSTDGHKLAVMQTMYNDNLKDIIINENFQEINREYPNINRVIPNTEKYKIDTWKIEKYHYVKEKKIKKIYFCKNGEISFDASSKFLFCLDANNLKYIADGSSYEIKYFNKLKPIVINLRNDFIDYVLVMPVRA